MSDISSTETTTAGITRKIFPEMPGTKNIGMNAATVVSTLKATGIETPRAPSMAARRKVLPSSRFS